MRVLILSKHDLYYGGVGEVVRQLALNLPRHGISPVLASAHPSAAKFGREIGLEVHITRLPRGVLSNPIRRVNDVHALVRLAQERSVALCHAHSAHSPGVAARCLRHRLSVPYAVSTHGELLPQVTRTWGVMRRRRVRGVLRDASAVIHPSAAVADAANRFAEHRGHCWVLPHGCDVQWWRERGAARRIDRPYVLVMSRLVGGKGLELLIDAHDMMVRRGCDISLVLAGSGPSAAELARRAGKNHPVVYTRAEMETSNRPVVWFCGYVAGEIKRDLVQDALFLVHPTPEREAFGLVLLEAAAACKAIVCFDLPAYRDILRPGQNADVLKEVDAERLAGALEALVKDTPRRIAYEEFNEEWALRFEWSEVARQYAEIFFKVVSGGMH